MRCGFWQVLIPAASAAVVLAGALAAVGADEKAAPAPAAKVRVLIIDGQSNHKWAETTPAIKEMLEKAGAFEVTVATTPPKKASKEDWAKFKPDFGKCDVVLLNYFGELWPDDVNVAFEKFVNGGGGLVFYHAAVASFPEWKEFNDMMGMGWRKPDQGLRLTLDANGSEVRTPAGQGPGSGHGPAHPFEIALRDSEHPVTAGLPAKFMHVKDELYQGMRGPLGNMHVLATGFADTQFKGTGANEPLVWTVTYGKGRVLVSLLGHDPAATTAPSSAVLLCRGLQWAATGKVSLPAPKDLGN